MYVKYLIQGNSSYFDSVVETNVYLPASHSKTLNLALLEDLFPYIGTYHFRLKFGDDTNSFQWLDLSQENDNIYEIAQNFSGIYAAEGEELLVFKVLPISFEDDGKGSLTSYEDERAICNETSGDWKTSLESTLSSTFGPKTAEDLKQAAKYGLGNAKRLLKKIK
mmetsp:Transcript_3359/g.5232  ORF Transcript_3359/g.5232 Transcript_3359/m.5232 type:complete len:165 (+) Transcript_3359:79-573(+)